MTPREQIAYLRTWDGITDTDIEVRDAVCDLAERGLRNEDTLDKFFRAWGAEGIARQVKVTDPVAILEDVEVSWTIDGQRMTARCAEARQGFVFAPNGSYGVFTNDRIASLILTLPSPVTITFPETEPASAEQQQ